MGCQGFFEILMITLISSKNLGGYRIMKHTVESYAKSSDTIKSKALDHILIMILIDLMLACCWSNFCLKKEDSACVYFD